MFTTRTAIFAAMFAVAFTTAASGAEPAKRWHPVTAADTQVSAPATTTPTPAARESERPSTQRVYIDPLTNAVVPAPVQTPEPETEVLQRAVPDLRLRRSADGFLYIDTTGYENTETATIDADGTLHMKCVEPGTEPPPAKTSTENPPSKSQTKREQK